jgi:phage/conjugal plasmid C-4 type zinc finger TraR family protein
MIKEHQVFQGENFEEAEMGQIEAIHNNMNAIDAIRARLGSGPGLSHCEECGDEIPAERRAAVAGVKLCIFCQEYLERN